MTSRREFGTITPARRKGYQTVRYWADLHDGRGYMRHTSTIKGTKRDASAWLAKMHIDHGSDAPTMTVRAVYETWYLPYITEHLAKRTVGNYRRAWENYIEPRWGSSYVTDIRPSDMQGWLLSLSNGTAETCVKVLSKVMGYAVQYELRESNPMDVAYRMPEKARKFDDGIYTLEECGKLADAVRGSKIECAFILSAFGSCRVGEAFGAMAEDVSEEVASNGMRCAVVRVCRQADKDGFTLDSTKNRWSERYVVVPEPWSLRIFEFAANGWPYLSGYDSPVNSREAGRIWDRACEAAGLPRRPFRNVRPSWRTYMSAELGANPETLERLMGHGGQTVTGRHYYRPKIMALVEEVSKAFAKD